MQRLQQELLLKQQRYEDGLPPLPDDAGARARALAPPDFDEAELAAGPAAKPKRAAKGEYPDDYCYTMTEEEMAKFAEYAFVFAGGVKLRLPPSQPSPGDEAAVARHAEAATRKRLQRILRARDQQIFAWQVGIAALRCSGGVHIRD